MARIHNPENPFDGAHWVFRSSSLKLAAWHPSSLRIRLPTREYLDSVLLRRCPGYSPTLNGKSIPMHELLEAVLRKPTAPPRQPDHVSAP